MAGIFVEIESDIQKLQRLKKEIENVKKELKSINIKVHVDIAKGMEEQLKSLTTQYNALVQKIGEAEGKIMLSEKRINQASEKIIKAQEQLTKAMGVTQTSSGGASTAANQAETESVQAQAKAYDELAAEIDAVMGTRSQNIRRMIEEQNAIHLINEEIKKLTKYQSGSSTLSASQQRRLEQLNASLLTHKTALSELRQSLNNSFKLDAAAATSMNALSQSLARMRMTYRELTEEERNSPFGKELISSIQQADAKIKQLDATIGNHQRNVGNYASRWNGLSMSIQQIGRELPSLAMGWNMFFLAISNNLPILADEIKRAKNEYNELKKTGQKATPVWKQIVSSLVSWQTALTVGITLLTMHGDKIVDWVSGLFGANESQKHLNESVKEFNSLIREGQVQSGMLLQTIRKTEAGTKGRYEAIKKFNDMYGKYLPNLLSENASLLEIEKAYKKVNKALMENAALKAQQSAIDKILEESLKEQSEALLTMQQSVGTKNAKPMTDTVIGWTEEFMQAGMKWQRTFNAIAENIQKRFGKVPDDFYTALEDYIKSVYASNKEISKIQERFNPFFDKKKADEAVVQNKVYWEQQRSELVKQLETLNDIEAEGRKGIEIKLKIKAIDEKLGSYSISSTKSENQILNQQSRIDELKQRQAQERIRQQIDLENQVEQARIDAMSDGAEKTRAQRELDNKKELEAIEQQKEEYKQKVIQSQKEIFDAQEELKAKQNPSYKKKSFDSSSVSVDTSMFDTIYGFTKQRQKNDVLLAERDAMNKYLQEYGTFMEKRQAITEEYNRKIAQATTEGDRKILQRQMDDALKEFDFNRFKEGINFADVFGNLGEQTTEALRTLREKLAEYINQAAKDLRPEDLKELQDAFSNIDFEIAGRDPFGELKRGLSDYKAAARDVKQAQQDLNTVMQGGEIVTGIYTDETGRLVKKLLTQEQAEKKLSDAQEKRQKTLEKLTMSANSIGQTGGRLVNSGNEIIDMLDTFGVSVSENVTGALDGLGQVMSGLESIDLTKPFSALTGSVTILTGLGKTIGSIFGIGGADYSGYETMKEQYDRLIDVWNTLIDRKLEYISIDYGAEAQKAADEAARLTEANIARQRLLMESLASSGSSVGSHSLTYRINARMNASDWDALSRLVGQRVEGFGDVIGLDADVIGKVLEDEHFVSVLASINSEFIDYIQSISDYGEKLDEIAEKEKEAITGIGFDSFYDGYVDMLTDLDATNEDFANDFEKYLQQSILSSLVANQYKERIQALYDSWTELGKDGLTSQEADKLREEYQQITDDLLADRDKLMNDFGWTSGTSSEQSATAKETQQITYDQASHIEGRMNAIYEAQLRGIDIYQNIYNVADESRSILASSFLELQQISENTGEIIKPIKQMQQDIAEVRRNTARI